MVDGFGRPELYDLAADPRERMNLCAHDREPCAPLAAELQAWQARNAEAIARLALPPAMPAAIDEQTGERLRALGYAE